MKDYYKILGIPRFSDIDTIKASYKELVKKYHPDKNKGHVFYHELMQELNEAYSLLGNIEDKNNYDQLLKMNPDAIHNSDLEKSKQKHKFHNNVKLNNKYQQIFTIIGIVFILFILVIIDYYYWSNKQNTKTVKSKNNIPLIYTPETKTEKLTPSTGFISLDELNLIPQQNKTYKEQQSLIEKDKFKSNNHESIKRTNKKSIKKWCDHVFITPIGNNISIINHNEFSIYKVDVSITYKEKYQTFPNESLGYETEHVSFHNVEPGSNLFKFFKGDIISISIIRCYDYSKGYSLPSY